MARQPQVTRTIITTHIEALCVNTKDKLTITKSFILPRTYKDEKAILKAIEKSAILADNERVVSVINAEEVETLYGMSEQKFIENAVILPPRSKTDAETGETTDTETEN